MTKLINNKDRALALQNEIIKHLTMIGNHRYEIARLAKIFIDEQLYLDLGFNEPGDWAEHVFGIGIRTFQFLISIENKFDECGISDDIRNQIEWTKAREIKKILTPDNATEWIEKARTLTVKELKDEVAGKRAAENTHDHKPIGYLYIPYYDDDQKATMFEAMELAAKMTASDRKEVQFIAMCQECISSWLPYADMIDDTIRKAILERDNYQCRCCGKRKNLDIHEVLPKSQGGKVCPENSITLCRIPCHDDITNKRLIVEKIGEDKYKFIKNKS